ncbi:MAG: methylenetetrahydrofolate reductase (NADPH) [Parasphingorhabdus sp.]|jgi:methylenetetrahydrofolate reductase (NADPH)
MSQLRAAFEKGDFVITCELSPPKGTDLSPLIEKANNLKSRIHAFNLTDSAAARMTLDPVVAGYELMKQGVEPIVQITSRDKNRLAIQSGMLGAGVLGIPNVVVMGGDPPKIGDHPDAKGVYDLFASQIIDAAHALNNGKDLAGNVTKGSTSFFIGSVFNPGANDIDGEVENTRRKIDAGTEFFQTQAVFETAGYENFMQKIDGGNQKVLAGIIPIKSVKMATYMNERVPGIDIPEHMIERVRQAEADDNVLDVSIDIAANTINQLRGKCSGIHIMAIGWERHIPRLLEQAGL